MTWSDKLAWVALVLAVIALLLAIIGMRRW